MFNFLCLTKSGMNLNLNIQDASAPIQGSDPAFYHNDFSRIRVGCGVEKILSSLSVRGRFAIIHLSFGMEGE